MKVFQTTDHHIKNEEPFYKAGVALDTWLIARLEKETEDFIYLDGGDRFHVNKETGRVNGEVVRLFSELAALVHCKAIFVIQGNHDVKTDSGSALDVIRNLNPKIHIVDTPFVGDKNLKGFYFLPHMRPYSVEGYLGIKSYGNEDWHRAYWETKGKNWDEIKSTIKLVSMHAGDESTGEFFQDVDISFLPGKRSNGHIHKNISVNHLVSASITRRDEKDKRCIMRIIDTDTFSIDEEDIPLFLNYAAIPYGGSIEEYFQSKVHILPKESLILDIYGHDDEDAVRKEYSEKYLKNEHPTIYIGQVTPVERKGDEIKLNGGKEDYELDTIDIKGLFKEFCEEKKVTDTIRDDLLARL